MPREDRQARRAQRRAYRAANRSERRESRSARQAQRQGFIANLAPSILDKIPSAQQAAAPAPQGLMQGDAVNDGAGGLQTAGMSQQMKILLAIAGVALLMKKK